MQTSNDTSICIARHTIQFIWNISAQQNSMGLLGSKNGISIDSARDISLYKPAEITPAIEQWEKENITLCGIFHCNPIHAKSMQQYEEVFKMHGYTDANMPFIHLNILLDTKGCLESEAWLLEQGKPIKIALVLLEDGQLQSLS